MEQYQTDSELVLQARTGDKQAFGQLIERHQQMVRRIAGRVIAQPEVARELAQEAMLQAYLSLEQLRDVTRFKSWLYGITLNVCHSYLRSQKANELSLEALLGGVQGNVTAFLATVDSIDPHYIAEQHELHQIVLRAVESLSPKDRVATLLFYYDQLSLSEIAALLGVSVGTIKGRLHRARTQLKARLFTTYSELHGLEQARRQTMRKMLVHAVRHNVQTQQFTVILYDEVQSTALMIWIGPTEAAVIANALNKQMMPRPMTINLLVNLLKATGVQLEEVNINALKDEVFYATVKVRNGNVVQEIDARPSDAIGLALLMEQPLYVSEEVIERCGVAIPQDVQLSEAVHNLASEQAIIVKSIVMAGLPTLSDKKLDEELQEVATLMAQLRTGNDEERKLAGEKLLLYFTGVKA